MELMSRLDASEEWRQIGDMDVQSGLPRAVKCLRGCLKNVPRKPLPDSVAFIGGPGSGKTTALCKLLARDVFIENEKPQVLRLEVDKPHLDDGLPMYCEVLGLRCVDSVRELERNNEGKLYVDIPGYNLNNAGELNRIGKSLDELDIEGRVMVLNAAYQRAIQKRFLLSASSINIGHVILTHVDEMESFEHLWHYVFDSDRTLVFLSNGQNIAGDRIDDPFGFLLQRTFPR
jgi:flagellar biosynthesis protein FlhF